MSWLEPADVADVYGVEIPRAFIDHVQALAEVCVGEQTEPISTKLAATFVDVVYRKWLAKEQNPSGITQEQLGPYMYSMQGAPGLGLTDADCKRLKKAAGISGLWVQPLTRGRLETAGPPIEYWAEEESSSS